MSSKPEPVASVEIGLSADKLSEMKGMEFKFHNFASLGSIYVSPPLTCHGIQWKIILFPFGGGRTRGMSSFYLLCEDVVKGGKESVSAEYTFRGMGIGPVKKRTFTKEKVHSKLVKLSTREHVLSECLIGEALVIRINIAVLEQVTPVWKPKNCLSKTIASLWGTDKHSDVTISLDDADGKSFKAHKLILSLFCPVLKDLIEEHKTAETIPLAGVDPALFEALLFFLYNEELPTGFSVSDSGLGLLKLANRLGCTQLKLFLEAEVVSSQAITVENAADLLTFADSHALALLKETAMDFVIANLAQVRASDGWKMLQQSANLMEELFADVMNRTDGAIVNPRVSHLRKRLSDFGRDADGTYEMLSKRVKRMEDGEGVLMTMNEYIRNL